MQSELALIQEEHLGAISSRIAPLEIDTEELLEDFRRDCEDRHMAESTIRRYATGLHCFFAFLRESKTPVLQVDRHVLKNFIHYRRVSGGEENSGVRQKTIENDFSALSLFYEFLVFEDYIQSSPVLAVRKRYLVRYKDDADSESPMKLISIDEMGMLVNSTLSPRDKAVVLLLAKTGLRRRELISVDIADVNWVEQSITLKARKFKKRSNRIVFFDDETGRILREWMRIRSAIHSEADSLFLNERGGRLNRNGVYSLVTKCATQVGLHNPASERQEEHFTPHCCRHWFTTHLRRSGMDREFIKVLRGDARNDSMSVYDHIDREELRKSYLANIPQLGL